MSRTFNAVSTLTKARNGELSVDELRKAVAALDFGKSDVAFELQAILEQRTGLRLKPTAKENSLTNAWLAAGVKGVRNIQYSWSAIADDGVPVFTVWSQYLPDKATPAVGHRLTFQIRLAMQTVDSMRSSELS
jgi:hypothetical protein